MEFNLWWLGWWFGIPEFSRVSSVNHWLSTGFNFSCNVARKFPNSAQLYNAAPLYFNPFLPSDILRSKIAVLFFGCPFLESILKDPWFQLRTFIVLPSSFNACLEVHPQCFQMVHSTIVSNPVCGISPNYCLLPVENPI